MLIKVSANLEMDFDSFEPGNSTYDLRVVVFSTMSTMRNKSDSYDIETTQDLRVQQ